MNADNMNDAILFSIRLSLEVALLSALLVTLAGGAIGYLFATRKFRGKTFLQIAAMLPLVLPPTVTGYLLVLLFGRGGVIGQVIYHLTGWTIMFTWWAAVLASFVVSLPLMVKSAEIAIGAVDRTMIETSYTLGCKEWKTAIYVVLPLAKKGMLAGIVLAFARGLGEFGATLMLAGNIPLRTNTMPLTIYSLAASGEWNKAHVLAGILTLTSALFLWIVHRLGTSSSGGFI